MTTILRIRVGQERPRLGLAGDQGVGQRVRWARRYSCFRLWAPLRCPHQARRDEIQAVHQRKYAITPADMGLSRRLVVDFRRVVYRGSSIRGGVRKSEIAA